MEQTVANKLLPFVVLVAQLLSRIHRLWVMLWVTKVSILVFSARYLRVLATNRGKFIVQIPVEKDMPMALRHLYQGHHFKSQCWQKISSYEISIGVYLHDNLAAYYVQ